jgi:hypothetical protein
MSPDKPAGPETNISVDVPYATINLSVTPYTLTRHLSIPIHLNKADRSHKALLDSGAMGSFIHKRLVEDLKLIRMPRNPLPLMDVKGVKIGELVFQVNGVLEIMKDAGCCRLVTIALSWGSHGSKHTIRQ